MSWFSENVASIGLAHVVNPLAAQGVLGLAGMSGDAFSAYQDRQAVKEANQQNIALSREQMAFQERMSSTAHQREVEDLRKAGLNPILSAHGGASSPGGSSTVVAPLPSIAGRVMSGARDSFEKAMALARLRSELREAQSRIDLNQAHRRSVDLDVPRQQFENKKNSIWNKFLDSLLEDLDENSAKSKYKSESEKWRREQGKPFGDFKWDVPSGERFGVPKGERKWYYDNR